MIGESLFRKVMWRGKNVVPIVFLFLLIVPSLYCYGQDIYSEAKKELVDPRFLQIGDTWNSSGSCFLNEKGEPSGYYAEICQRFAERMGVKLKTLIIDWPGVLPGLSAERFDMGGCQATQTVERLGSDAYIASIYYLGQGTRLLVLEDSDIKNWDDIKDKVIGGLKGGAEYRSVKALYPSAKYKEYGGFTEIMLDVVNRRVAGGIMPELILANTIKQNPDKKLKPVCDPIDYTPRGTFFPPNHVKVAKAFNAFIEELRASGELDRLSKHWFGMEFDWQRLQKVHAELMEKAGK